MLEHDNIVAPEQILFTLNVNAEIRVLFVEIVDGHILQVTHGRDQSPVNPGFLQGRVGKLDQDSFSHGRFGNLQPLRRGKDNHPFDPVSALVCCRQRGAMKMARKQVSEAFQFIGLLGAQREL
jgi:hypothetical protein